MKKSIGIMCATFNEEQNIQKLVDAIDAQLAELNDLINYRIVFIDNDSEDQTQKILRDIANSKSHVSCIFNERNYGANRSSFHGMLETPGDAVVMMCSDFQDPPELLPELVKRWLNGERVIMCRKSSSDEKVGYRILRAAYYRFLAFSHPMYRDIIGCTGFGIYDRKVIERLRSIDDNYPFFRGLIAETCSSIEYLEYRRPFRMAGRSSMNLYRLWDEGVIGLINNSKVAIRFITIFGVFCAFVSCIFALVAVCLKLFYWDLFPMGVAPILLLQLFSVGCVMFSLGIIGEYVGAIYTQSIGRSCVYEKERLNL